MDDNIKKEQENVEEMIVDFNETEQALTPQDMKKEKRKKEKKRLFHFLCCFYVFNSSYRWNTYCICFQ